MQNHSEQIFPLYSSSGTRWGLRSVAHETRAGAERGPRARPDRSPQTEEPVAEEPSVLGLDTPVGDEADKML